MSVYTPEITQLQVTTKAESVYAFVVEGERGTGGMPLVSIVPEQQASGSGVIEPAEYVARCRKLLGFMQRSVELFERDIRMMTREAVVSTPGRLQVEDELTGAVRAAAEVFERMMRSGSRVPDEAREWLARPSVQRARRQ